jgi:hypothetical protein
MGLVAQPKWGAMELGRAESPELKVDLLFQLEHIVLTVMYVQQYIVSA